MNEDEHIKEQILKELERKWIHKCNEGIKNDRMFAVFTKTEKMEKMEKTEKNGAGQEVHQEI